RMRAAAPRGSRVRGTDSSGHIKLRSLFRDFETIAGAKRFYRTGQISTTSFDLLRHIRWADRLMERRRTMLKTIMIGAGLAPIIATSAIAQSFDPSVGSGNIAPGTTAEYGSTGMRAGANAYAFERGNVHHHSVHHERMMDRDAK